MLARLLYGGGLALVAAQLFADGHVCGPGCSSSADGFSDGSFYRESVPLPPDFGDLFRDQLNPGSSFDPRSMLRAPNQAVARQEWLGGRGVEYRGRVNGDERGYRSHDRGHSHRYGQWQDQASRSQRNDGWPRRYDSPQRGYDAPSMQTPRETMPPRGSEDFQPMPQPSLPPQVGGYRGNVPAWTPPQQPRSMRRPSTAPSPLANAWNI